MTRLLPLLCSALALAAQDTDRDGLTDRQEQDLLNRFAPRFLVDSKDCDALPSTLQPGSAKPVALSRNGQIYGQVFPVGNGIEVHYYHLWRRDCGRRGHPLDAEHVAVLLSGSGDEWKAAYWFASAHQKTICDISHAASAAFLEAEDAGPAIWISAGKHGSFLSADSCAGGCGSDRCGTMVSLPRAAVVNIGERDVPMNGAVWTASAAWPLQEKMTTDFSPEVLALIQGADGIVALQTSGGSVRGTIAVAAMPVDSTGAALGTAQRKTGSSIGRARRAVWGQIKKVTD